MEKLFFATDFSERSRNVFPFALDIARLFGAQLVLLHVYQIPDTYKFPYTAETLEYERNEIEESRNKLQKIFDTLYGADYSDVDVQYRVVKDTSVFRGIMRAVHDEFPAMLMLGAKGDNISQDDYFGGVVHDLIKHAIVPVMTIPEGFEGKRVDKIVFATNYYLPEITVIKQLVEKLKSIKPEITIVHVRSNEESDDSMNEFRHAVQKEVDYPNLTFQELLSNDIYNRLNSYIADNEFDLIAMTNKQHGGIFYRLLHDDLLQKIETQSNVPVLSFNDEGIDIIIERDQNVQTFKDSIRQEMKEMKEIEENKILTAISRVTKEIETDYPELYVFLEEEPITLPTENHPNVDIDAMSSYLDSLEQKLKGYKESKGKGNKALFTKVYK